THLESFDAQVQVAQAEELLAGPANCDLPTILIGDINSDGNRKVGSRDTTPTYPMLLEAGFNDVWAAVNPGAPGFTGVQPVDLRNQEAALFMRIDLLLTRGAVTPISAELHGATPDIKTKSGLWPTDHAGLLASLRIS